jgi:uncharacterized protein
MPLPVILFVALTLPFLLNDIGFIWATSPAQWLGVDYATKIVVIGLIAGHPFLRQSALGSLTWPRSIWFAGTSTLAVTAISIVGLSWIDDQGLDAATALQTFPGIDQTWLVIFDLTVGLALTAVAEELVFRRLYLDTFAPILPHTSLYLVSAAIFAAIHWSSGLGTVAGAFVVGLMLLWLTRRTGSLLPAIAAHFAINLVLFWP